MIVKCYHLLMKKVSEKTYSTKEVQEGLDRYLDSSANKLRVRLKNAWKKQVTARQLTHVEAKI